MNSSICDIVELDIAKMNLKLKNSEDLIKIFKNGREIPRPEYPRPQFLRSLWQNLNGLWKFDFDRENKGFLEHWEIEHEYPMEIIVPYVFQSKLSGINIQEPVKRIWYERAVKIKPVYRNERLKNYFSNKGNKLNDFKKILLHIGGCDFKTYVFINGVFVGSHEGGFSSFYLDITNYIYNQGPNFELNKFKITITVEDDNFDPAYPRGKQNLDGRLSGAYYENITGIWQTIWLEFLPEYYFLPEKTYIHTHTNSGIIEIHTELNEFEPNLIVEAEIYENPPENRESSSKLNPEAFYFEFSRKNRIKKNIPISFKTSIPQNKIRKWQPKEQGNNNGPQSHAEQKLYYLDLILRDGNAEDEDYEIDRLTLYFAFRDISIEDSKYLINGQEFYLKSLLYQGLFPDSLLTPPTEEHIINDLILAQKMGFNHLRLHQFAADPLLLYWADKLGITLWGEAANSFVFNPTSQKSFVNEWMDIVLRDRNHPSIIAWVPINESWGFNDLQNSEEEREYLRSLYFLTKSLDSTRPVIDNDGWEHVKTDIVTIHMYRLPKLLNETKIFPIEPPELGSTFDNLRKLTHRPVFVGSSKYEGQPVIITEWGGWGYDKEDPDITPSKYTAWGYNGKLFKGFEEIKELYKKYLEELNKRRKWIKGYCYTQFCDQFQEKNGILTFSRELKVDIEEIKKLNSLFG
ncbi:MAG: glycoside hydrolase family 2 protein [Promethearchaeota archaeon]